MIKVEIFRGYDSNVQTETNDFLSNLDPKQIIKMESSSSNDYVTMIIIYGDLAYIRDNNIKTLLEYNDI